MPSTKAAACSPDMWWGSSQHSERVDSSRARPSATAAATRARSGVSSARAPSPTSSQRRPAAWVTATLRSAGLASPLSTSA